MVDQKRHPYQYNHHQGRDHRKADSSYLPPFRTRSILHQHKTNKKNHFFTEIDKKREKTEKKIESIICRINGNWLSFEHQNERGIY